MPHVLRECETDRARPWIRVVNPSSVGLHSAAAAATRKTMKDIL
jgi:hypothetical protein